MEHMPPAIMVGIGSSRVDGRRVANFLLVEVGGDALAAVRATLDLLGENYHNRSLAYLVEEPGRFIFRGFHRQMLDLLMLRKGIRSNVVADPLNGQICFPEADASIERIHRREKALYALFMLETASGGINFNKPETARGLARYTRRMEAVQAKYEEIYRMFGGEEGKAPDLAVPEIRLPMISLLKRQLKKLDGVLFHVDDYTIRRNIYGNYALSLPAALCHCREGADGAAVPMAESEAWRRIAAL
jgi:hypothetical protein